MGNIFLFLLFVLVPALILKHKKILFSLGAAALCLSGCGKQPSVISDNVMFAQSGNNGSPSGKVLDNQALLAACQNCPPDLVAVILAVNDVNQVIDSDGDTLLWIGSVSGYTDFVKLLLDYGADVNKPNKYNVTPLMVAALEGHTEIVKSLLDKGAKAVWSDDGERTPVLMACQINGNAQTVKLLLDAGAKEQINKSELDMKGDFPLRAASSVNKTEIVKLLIEAGADVNKTAVNGDTALMQAAGRGYLEIAQMLLAAGANPNAVRQGDGATALFLAASREHKTAFEIVKLLVRYGANVNAEAPDGLRVLDHAENYGLPVVSAFLKKQGATNGKEK